MLKMLWLKLFGGCDEGIHDFQKFLVKSIPRSSVERMSGYVDPEQLERIIELTHERAYEIRCQRCGRKPQ